MELAFDLADLDELDMDEMKEIKNERCGTENKVDGEDTGVTVKQREREETE